MIDFVKKIENSKTYENKLLFGSSVKTRMQCNITMKYEDTHSKKNIYRPRDTEKTVWLSSQVSPENILQKPNMCNFQRANKKIEERKKEKSTKTNKENIYWMESKV